LFRLLKFVKIREVFKSLKVRKMQILELWLNYWYSPSSLQFNYQCISALLCRTV